MNRTNAPLVVALMLLCPAPADAAPAIHLPLSHYGSLIPPRLETKKLTPATRKNVEEAIAAARRASQAALAAEDMVQAAVEARDDAGKSTHGYGVRDVSITATPCRYQGELTGGRATGLGVMRCGAHFFAGRFRDGRLDGLGGDYLSNLPDAYEGGYRDGARSGLGVERDKDGFYPGLYGFVQTAQGQKINMEILGLQDFADAHWAGRYGSYSGPKISCTLIKGAVLEGSVLDGYGAKFDGHGELIEQGLYTLGVPQNGSGPPC